MIAINRAELTPPALPVVYGSKDRAAVLRLQEYLVITGCRIWADDRSAPGIDGDFGDATRRGVESFAAAQGIAPIVNDAFWQRLTAPLSRALDFRPATPTLGAAILEVARAHAKEAPREARVEIAGRLLGTDNSGPWARTYLRSSRLDPWCLGFTNSVVAQAALALGVDAPLSPMLDGIWCLWVPRMVDEARRLRRLVTAESGNRVGPGSLFFVRGTINGAPSHIHVGIVAADLGATVQTIEGNTNTDGSANGWVVCARTRTRGSLDFGVM